MFYYISGTLEQSLENAVVLDSNGVGYLIHVSGSTLSKLPPKGESLKLYTNMQVKEDGIALYGFLSLEESHIFALLITVSGVGPRAALGLLTVMTPAQVMIAILSDDTASLCKAPGVGKKTAQRVSLELRDKIKTADAAMETIASAQQNLGMSGRERQDAVDALIALGYSRGESMKAVMEIALEDMKTEQIIRLALKKLAS